MISHGIPFSPIGSARLGGGCPDAGTVRGISVARSGEPSVALFLSTYINKIDSKGRVSVPAGFRTALVGQAANAIIVYRSIKFPALDAAGAERFEELAARLDQLPEFSEERDSLASILPDAQQLAIDSDGRIVLPHSLATHAGLGTSAAFVGLGRTFQIWEPERFKHHQEEMRARARQRGLTLPPLGTPS
jgi:MraZ protein